MYINDWRKQREANTVSEQLAKAIKANKAAKYQQLKDIAANLDLLKDSNNENKS